MPQNFTIPIRIGATDQENIPEAKNSSEGNLRSGESQKKKLMGEFIIWTLACPQKKAIQDQANNPLPYFEFCRRFGDCNLLIHIRLKRGRPLVDHFLGKSLMRVKLMITPKHGLDCLPIVYRDLIYSRRFLEYQE